jgi:radical SAM protein with 4Fe4S-binding SPASM domain
MTLFNSFYYPKDDSPLPTSIMIEPSNGCNLKCIMCEVQQKKKDASKFLALSELKFILEQIPTIKELIFCGIGEPLLNKEIFSMIKYARERDIPFVNLITNGELLSQDIANKLLDSGLSQMHISLPGVTESAYQKIRNNPKSTLEEFSKKIKYLASAKIERKLKLKIILNVVMMKNNFNELERAVSFCKDIGADGICFVQLTTILGKNEDINIQNKRTISKSIAAIKETGKKKDLEIVFLTGNDCGRCMQMWNFMMIHADGEISPCNGIMPTENINVGNILKDNISDIWLSESYKDLRRKVRMGELRNCNYCESGYLIEGVNMRWLINYYIRPVRNIVVKKIKNIGKNNPN